MIDQLFNYLSICVFYLIYKCLKKEFKILTHKSFNVRLYITLQNNYFFKLKMNFIQLIYIYIYIIQIIVRHSYEGLYNEIAL